MLSVSSAMDTEQGISVHNVIKLINTNSLKWLLHFEPQHFINTPNITSQLRVEGRHNKYKSTSTCLRWNQNVSKLVSPHIQYCLVDISQLTQSLDFELYSHDTAIHYNITFE